MHQVFIQLSEADIRKAEIFHFGTGDYLLFISWEEGGGGSEDFGCATKFI